MSLCLSIIQMQNYAERQNSSSSDQTQVSSSISGICAFWNGISGAYYLIYFCCLACYKLLGPEDPWRVRCWECQALLRVRAWPLIAPRPSLARKRISCTVHVAKLFHKIKWMGGSCVYCHLKVVPHNRQNHTEFTMASSGTGGCEATSCGCFCQSSS